VKILKILHHPPIVDYFESFLGN